MYIKREGESKREKDRERKKIIKEAKEKMEALYIDRYIETYNIALTKW